MCNHIRHLGSKKLSPEFKERHQVLQSLNSWCLMLFQMCWGYISSRCSTEVDGLSVASVSTLSDPCRRLGWLRTSRKNYLPTFRCLKYMKPETLPSDMVLLNVLPVNQAVIPLPQQKTFYDSWNLFSSQDFKHSYLSLFLHLGLFYYLSLHLCKAV